MLWLTITGANPYDGRYEFDLTDAEFTTREWGWIKRHSGYLPLTIQDGFEGGDPELFAVFAAIALHRVGKVDRTDVATVIDRLADAPFGSTIRLEDDSEETEVEEVDAGPPASNSNGNAGFSGAASSESSVSSDGTPNDAGTDGSATSELPPTRLVT